MDDLLALAELFGLRVIKKSSKRFPTITVALADDELVNLWRRPDGKIWATNCIPGIPMRYIGCGSWQYAAEL